MQMYRYFLIKTNNTAINVKTALLMAMFLVFITLFYYFYIFITFAMNSKTYCICPNVCLIWG